MEHSQAIYYKRVQGKGRGVFARQAIRRDSMIESAPVILVPVEHLLGGMHSPVLSRFFYLWNEKKVAISLGYGSLYNHSYEPNAFYRHGHMAIKYFALRDIEPDEEITVNYNGEPEDMGPVGFKVI